MSKVNNLFNNSTAKQIIEKDTDIKFMIENNCIDDLLILYRCLNHNETFLLFL